MKNILNNTFNSIISETAIFLIFLCGVIAALADQPDIDLTDISLAMSIVEALLLFSWLIWSTYIIVTKKSVKKMPDKYRIAIEIGTQLLCLYWVYLRHSSFIIIIPAAMFFAWQKYTDIRDVMSRRADDML